MTLVEILAVLVILGLISATLFVSFYGSFGKARHEIARSQIGLIMNQLEMYNVEKGAYPDNSAGLAALTDGMATPKDPYYLDPGQILDPWERPYLYLTPGPDGKPYEISTYGSDGQQGGEGEAADLSSANLRGIQR